ncbi:MAG: alpha/beta fold hydrolase [Bdellovibrionales bacterium]|nr:alpha/beta fold hydrolase [Bdellovibrionales bacterium]
MIKVILPILLLVTGCQSFNKKQNVAFSEFQKVLTPRSKLFPINEGTESLLLIRQPKDKYTKLYKLNHKSKKFTLQYDAGQNINYLTRDRSFKNFYFLMDDNGDENYQIYSFDPETKTTQHIFGKAGFKAMPMGFSNQPEFMYLTSNHQNKAQYTAYRLNLKTGELKLLTQSKINIYSGLVDPRGRYIAVSDYLGNNEVRLYLINLKTFKTTKILSKASTVYKPAFFHPTKNELYISTNQNKDFMGCAKVNLNNPSKINWVFSDKNKSISCDYRSESNISFKTISQKGRINVEMYSGVYNKKLNVNFPEKSLIGSFSEVSNSTKAIVKISSANNPGTFYIFDYEQNTKLEPIFDLNISSIKNSEFANSYDFNYKSFDGLKIHGIIYAKKQWVNSDIKRPVILWPHGGPDSYEAHVYHPFFQYWVQNGYVVFAPNFRGSSGYGKTFETLNDKDWGGGHIKDLIYGKKALEKLNYIDSDNIFIVGASFGGYSTLSAITQYPNEFKGAVAIVALANLFTFMESIPKDPTWQNEFKTEVGDPIKDKKLLKERSPYFFADKVQIPLKIYQAENDIRTVKAEMDNFVKQLNKYNIPVEYEVLKNEGHGLSRKESWKKVMQGTIEFLNTQRDI